MGSNIWQYKLIFCPQVEEKKCIASNFLEKIILITRIWSKSVFRVWQLSTLVPIKMLVSSPTKLHTPCQTLSFSTVSKEQHLFQSITRLNPVFHPILTVTIVTVNMGWNTGFSQVTDLNKGCSLLKMLKLKVCWGVCSYVRLDTYNLTRTWTWLSFKIFKLASWAYNFSWDICVNKSKNNSFPPQVLRYVLKFTIPFVIWLICQCVTSEWQQ